ncbi:MAG: DUF1134 domain-containing protein [Porphyrobacter sp.]|nr:DUF1134 domain-containing protein [Porphyrobacter sp.]
MAGMIGRSSGWRGRIGGIAIGVVASIALAVPGHAQDLETVDPDQAYEAQSATTAAPASGIDGDLAAPQSQPAPAPAEPGYDSEPYQDAPATPPPGEADPVAPLTTADAQDGTETYGEDDLIGAAEGVFGKGAEGLARMIEDLLAKQGKPNAYIVGREAGGAFIVGARYGSGTLHHKVEGERKVYWTGPSIGFDAGANAANTFVLVYNLYDTEDLYKRFPAGEGQAYFVGGLTASYLRWGDIVLIPIRMGAGLRLGVNAGYMKFSKKQRWLPF